MYCFRLWDLVEILSMGVLKTMSLYQSKIIIHGGSRRNLAFKWFVWKNQSSLSPCFPPSPSFLSPFFLCFQPTAEQQVGQFIGFVLRYKGSIDFYKKLIDIYFLHSCVYLRVEINLLLTTPTDALEQPGFPQYLHSPVPPGKSFRSLLWHRLWSGSHYLSIVTASIPFNGHCHWTSTPLTTCLSHSTIRPLLSFIRPISTSETCNSKGLSYMKPFLNLHVTSLPYSPLPYSLANIATSLFGNSYSTCHSLILRSLSWLLLFHDVGDFEGQRLV